MVGRCKAQRKEGYTFSGCQVVRASKAMSWVADKLDKEGVLLKQEITIKLPDTYREVRYTQKTIFFRQASILLIIQKKRLKFKLLVGLLRKHCL